MSIKISLLKSPGFIYEGIRPRRNSELVAATGTEQNQQFRSCEIRNGYGTATSVSVSPGYGATVSADVKIVVNSITEEVFQEIIEEVKKSDSYKNNSSFRQEIEESDYTESGSSSSGIFGWLVGNSSSSYTNNESDLTETINQYDSGNSSDDITVANSIADIMVKSSSKVNVTASVQVTGQLLVPSPTVIAVESTVFSFVTEDGTESSVTMINQTPVVPVNVADGTVSRNTVAPGTALNITPIGG